MKYLRVKQAVLEELAQPQPRFLLSENSLAERFAVSRMTARRALQELQNEGFLSRQQGKASAPAERRFSQGFLRVRPFYEFAQANGLMASTQVLHSEVSVAPTEIAQKLGTSRVIWVQRLRFLDAEPVQLETRYLHPKLCKKVLEFDLTAESIHDILVHKLNLPLTKVWQRLEAVNLDQNQAKHLHQPTGAAGLRLERLTYTLEQPVTWVEYLMRGDRYYLEETFTPGGERP